MNTHPPAHDDLLDVMLAEYLARLDRGESVPLQELYEAHPGLAADLREFLEMSHVLEQLGQGTAAELAGVQLRSTADAVRNEPTLADAGCKPLLGNPLLAAAKKGTHGARFGRYFLQDLLGEGSMGSVHLAYDTALDRFVALKMPRFQGEQHAAAFERFRREARASAMVRHVNICPIFDVGTIDGQHFLSMAYIDGETLARALERGDLFSVPRSLHLIRRLAEALDEAHRHEVIHRDLKPANIMLDHHGEPIITDFGLARRLDMRETLLTQSGMLVGTLPYMSPEQLEGKPEGIGRATDIYSLGVILYQLLCGRLPYRGGFLSVVLQIRAGTPEAPALHRPELQAFPGVEDVCLKMMAADPACRFASMAEVVRAIAELQGEPLPPPVAVGTSGITPTVEIPPCEPPPIAVPERSATWLDDWVRFPNDAQGWAIHGLGALAIALSLTVLIAMTIRLLGPGSQPAHDPSAVLMASQAAAADLPSQPPASGTAEQHTVGKPALPAEVVAQGAPAVNKTAESAAIPARRLPTEQPPDRQPFVFTQVQPPGNAIGPQPGVAPPLPRPTPQMEVKSRRSLSEPFGVVEVQVKLPAGEVEFRRDWACRISADEGQVFYPAYRMELAEEAEPAEPKLAHNRGAVRTLTASFLTSGNQPLVVNLSYGDRLLLARHKISPAQVEEKPGELLNAWWASYTQSPREPLNLEAREIKSYLHDMLARRLELPAAPALPSSNAEKSMLQNYFEKSVGTFLGFSSVRTALGEQNRLAPQQVEPLDRPLPLAPPILSVQFPEPAQVAVETLAWHVPEDCVYLRCHSVENYLWFRDLMLDWGGGLQEVVSPRQIEIPIRQRLESQLALKADPQAHAQLHKHISDLAVVFGDTCFEDGAAVGVLFQAKNNQAVRDFLHMQRQRGLKEFQRSRAVEMQVRVGGNEVSLLTTSDKRLRSFYAVFGNHHFVTNSEYLVRRFFEASRGQRNLASLKEFRYARSKARLDTAQDVFLYMPDPFFQRIIRPEYQIEIARRGQAKRDLQHLELARLAAQGEGLTITSLAPLLERGFLPTAFSNRSDGSMATLGSGQAEDSLRGRPGTFLPICDMQITRATASEVKEYEAFASHYRGQYRRLDPVAVVVSHQQNADGRELVKVEITVTPFALGTYEPIRLALSEPQKSQIVGPPGELLSLRASLRTKSEARFLCLASIHDTEVPFQIVDGQLQAETLRGGESFATSNWQLAMNRQDPECRETLLMLVRQTGGTQWLAIADEALQSLVGAYAQVIGSLFNLPLRFDRGSRPSTPSGPGWQVRSPREDLRDEKALSTVPNADNHQVRFKLKALQGTKVEPYIQAYTYLEARQASARQAALLELTMQQFGLNPHEVLPALESIHSARILCPLEGRWQFANHQWSSDRWTKSSLYDEEQVPADYRFAFTDWLRDLDMGFSLKGQTLSADLSMEIAPRAKANALPAIPPQAIPPQAAPRPAGQPK
jgi:hypothetical protein